MPLNYKLVNKGDNIFNDETKDKIRIAYGIIIKKYKYNNEHFLKRYKIQLQFGLIDQFWRNIHKNL